MNQSNYAAPSVTFDPHGRKGALGTKQMQSKPKQKTNRTPSPGVRNAERKREKLARRRQR